MPRQPIKIDLVTKFLHSDRIKYKKALALQNLNSDPDEVFVDIKYHFAWNVTKRLPVFRPNSHITGFVHGKLMEYSEKVGCLVDLLWLAPDHVHLYVNSDGKDSVETLVQGIKRFSRDPLIHELTRLEGEADPKSDLWDEAYFSETIG
jgi:REP element-mobilizing transposase RayT